MQRAYGEATHASLVLRVDKLYELRRALNIASDTDLAEIIGVDPATLWRVVHHKTAPSNAFIARLKLAFPTVALDALFEVKQKAAS